MKELEEKRRRMPGMPKFPGKGLRKPKYAALARAKGAVLSRKFFRETPTQHWLLGTLTTGQEDKTELRLGPDSDQSEEEQADVDGDHDEL